MTENLRRDADQRAREACRTTRDDAADFLKGIEVEGDTYIDGTDKTADVDVTRELSGFFRSVIERMDVALVAFEGRGP
jgi:hypothetical protein